MSHTRRSDLSAELRTIANRQFHECLPTNGQSGLDLLDFPTITFYESGYSLHTLRQASRRSWRIGQRWPVRVKFICHTNDSEFVSSSFLLLVPSDRE